MKLGKILKAVAAGYAFYKTNQDEIDSAARKVKKLVKGKKKPVS